MNETTFENAIVGDRVWDYEYGWGEIIDLHAHPSYPLLVQYVGTRRISYIPYGSRDIGLLRTLFWDEIKFEAPPRPERKVKKVIEGYINMWRMYTEEFNGCDSTVWKSKEEALAVRKNGRVYLGEPLFIHHEYEVEE